MPTTKASAGNDSKTGTRWQLAGAPSKWISTKAMPVKMMMLTTKAK